MRAIVGTAPGAVKGPAGSRPRGRGRVRKGAPDAPTAYTIMIPRDGPEDEPLRRPVPPLIHRGRAAMDQLWAPWRLSYVTAAKGPSPSDPCFICQGLAADNDRANLIVWHTPRSAVVLNRFPYNNGHLLVAPRAHKGRL